MKKGMQFPNERHHLRSAGVILSGIVAMLMLVATAAHAAAPTIDDRAKLFSDRAVSEANQSIARIYDRTTPHKQVFIETLPNLPAGKQADALAEQRFSQHDTDGVLIFIVKDPHKLAVTVGRSTQARFHDGEGLRTVMLDRFRHSDYDGGLLAGVRVLESRLTGEFSGNEPAGDRGAVYTQATERERSSASSSSWWWLLLLGGGGLLALLIWRLRSRAAQATSYDAPFGEPGRVYGASSASQPGPVYGQAPSAGGGLGRAIVGGAAGALAGNFLYDRLFRGDHDGEAHAATHHDAHDTHDVPSADHGDVGSTFGGHGEGSDWSDGGGGDSSFGDSGGGDW